MARHEVRWNAITKALRISMAEIPSKSEPNSSRSLLIQARLPKSELPQ